MDTVGKQESEASGEGSINIHTLSGVGWKRKAVGKGTSETHTQNLPLKDFFFYY